MPLLEVLAEVFQQPLVDEAGETVQRKCPVVPL